MTTSSSSDDSSGTLNPVTESLDPGPYSVTYTNIASAAGPWRSEQKVVIAIPDPSVDALQIPLPFFENSGDNTWQFAVFLLEQIVAGKGCIIEDSTGSQVVLSHSPAPGKYTYRPKDDNSTFAWVRGPEGANRYRAPRDEEGWDGSSGISAESGTASTFRTTIFGRDRLCIVTRKQPAQAAHLSPKNRIDIYKRVLGEDYMRDPFDPQLGIFLDNAIHTEYDRFKCSFYPKDGKIFFHAFTAMHEHHGKEITQAWANMEPAVAKLFPLPDTRLMAWHYSQCCMARIRGFSAGMALNRQ